MLPLPGDSPRAQLDYGRTEGEWQNQAEPLRAPLCLIAEQPDVMTTRRRTDSEVFQHQSTSPRGRMPQGDTMVAMSNWTVCAAQDPVDDAVYVVAVLPGDARESIFLPPSSGMHPILRCVTAETAAEAGEILRAEMEPTEPLPRPGTRESCSNCGKGRSATLRDVMGHDGPGHRLSNLLMRSDVETLDDFLAADLHELEALPQVGFGLRERLQQAQRRARRLRRLPAQAPSPDPGPPA